MSEVNIDAACERLNSALLVNAGAVNVVYGSSPSGESATAVLVDQFWQQDVPDLEGTSGDTQAFGNSVASG